MCELGLKMARFPFHRVFGRKTRSLLTASRTTFSGSSSLCVERWQHTRSQQFGSGPAIHCTLERLEAVDLAFGLSVAPGQFDGVVDGIDVPAQDASEPHDRNEFGVDRS